MLWRGVRATHMQHEYAPSMQWGRKYAGGLRGGLRGRPLFDLLGGELIPGLPGAGRGVARMQWIYTRYCDKIGRSRYKSGCDRTDKTRFLDSMQPGRYPAENEIGRVLSLPANTQNTPTHSRKNPAG